MKILSGVTPIAGCIALNESEVLADVRFTVELLVPPYRETAHSVGRNLVERSLYPRCRISEPSIDHFEQCCSSEWHSPVPLDSLSVCFENFSGKPGFVVRVVTFEMSQ